MALVFSDQGNNSAFTSGSVAASAVNVATDDLIVAHVGTVSSTIYCTGVTDTAGNTYTVRTQVANGNSSMVVAYVLAATAHATNVVTATFNTGSTRKNIIVSTYTPDGGDTVTLDVVMNGGSAFENSPWETGQDDTTGTDEVCVAAFQSNAGRTYSNQEIPSGSAATVLTSPDSGMTGFYRILSATQANNEAEVDVTSGGAYSCELVCFKSEGGASGLEPSVFDAVTIAEDVETSVLDLGPISISDSVGVAEALTEDNPLPGVSLSESISVAENLAVSVLDLIMSISDAIGVTENVEVSTLDLGNVAISDLVNIVEDLQLSVLDLGNISVADLVSIAENLEVALSILTSVSDSVSVAEDLTVIVSSVANLQTSITDAITIAENIAVSVLDLSDTFTSDSVTIGENVDVALDMLLNVSDTITITENLSVFVGVITDLEISVSDAISIAENLSVVVSALVTSIKRTYAIINENRTYSILNENRTNPII